MRYLWSRQSLIKGCVRRRFEQLLEGTFGVEHSRDSKHVLNGCAAGLLEATDSRDANAGSSRKLFLPKVAHQPQLASPLSKAAKRLPECGSVIAHFRYIVAVITP